MRNSLAKVTATGAIVAIAVAACSGGSQGPTSMVPGSVPVTAMRQPVAIDTAGHGITPDTTRLPKDLFVTDLVLNAVVILENTSWKNVGNITSGIDLPVRNWVDSKGNLYVTNHASVNVTEYAPKATSPTYTYSSGMSNPLDVTTDTTGNVFEADAGGSVNEYGQGINTVVATCRPGGNVESVAVDSSGDVFVAYNVSPSG